MYKASVFSCHQVYSPHSYYKRSYKNLSGTNMYIITKCIIYLQSQHKFDKQPREKCIGVLFVCYGIIFIYCKLCKTHGSSSIDTRRGIDYCRPDYINVLSTKTAIPPPLRH